MAYSRPPAATDEEAPGSLRVLTVGDGDLSFSLALKRAYPQLVQDLVATTLLDSARSLTVTYPRAAEILRELNVADGVEVLYGVDATRLHDHPSLFPRRPFDLILFHHPHLGYAADDDGSSGRDGGSRARHSCLLAHYFQSARRLLSPDPRSCVHVCLCGGSVENWDVHGVIDRLGLERAFGSPLAASRPTLSPWEGPTDDRRRRMGSSSAAAAVARGRRRRGHWLGRYGYRHQPTFPRTTEFRTNASNSYHYFLRPRRGADGAKAGGGVGAEEANGRCPPLRCAVCLRDFPDRRCLRAHELAPALPIEFDAKPHTPESGEDP